MKIQVGPFKNNVIITLERQEARAVVRYLNRSLNSYSITTPFWYVINDLINRLSDVIKKTWG